MTLDELKQMLSEGFQKTALDVSSMPYLLTGVQPPAGTGAVGQQMQQSPLYQKLFEQIPTQYGLGTTPRIGEGIRDVGSALMLLQGGKGLADLLGMREQMNRYNLGQRLIQNVPGYGEMPATRGQLQAIFGIERASLNPSRGMTFFGGLPVKFGGGEQPAMFQSKIAQVLSQSPQSVFSGAQLMGMLSGKVPKAELDEFDILKFAQQPKVYKQEVLDLINEKTPQVEEVVKSDTDRSPKLQEEMQRKRNEVYDKYETGQIDRTERDRLYGEIDREFPGTYTPASTKFNQYQLPGGENYREIGILAKTSQSPEQNRLEELVMKKNWTPSERAEVKELEAKFGTIAPTRTDFTNTHFPEWKNLLAHLRVNDRTTPDGKKVLFIEELQSDWARAAREPQNLDDIKHGNDVKMHPLLKNWQELALKRAIKEAVEGGYDYISWTTGEQQAERYDLSKVIDNLAWKETAGIDRKSVEILIRDQQPIDLWINSKGEVTSAATTRGGQEYIGKNIRDIIGKEHGEKVITQKSGDLHGADLKIGGEWAKNLYDRQIPNILKDLTKGEVENITFKTEKEFIRKGKGFTYPIETTQPAFKITPEMINRLGIKISPYTGKPKRKGHYAKE